MQATLNILALEAKIELEAEKVQETMTLEEIKEEFEALDSRYGAVLWEKYGKRRLYLSQWNGRNSHQYGFIEETTDGLVLNQSIATNSGCVQPMKVLLFNRQIPFTFTICKQFKKDYQF